MFCIYADAWDGFAAYFLSEHDLKDLWDGQDVAYPVHRLIF